MNLVDRILRRAAVAAFAIIALTSCSTSEPASAQEEPSPVPPATTADIDQRRAAPASGSVPAVADPATPQREVPLEIDPSPDDDTARSGAASAPVRDRNRSNDDELVVILENDDDTRPTRAAPPPSRVVMACNSRVAPESLSARVARLNELALSAGNAGDRARLSHAADQLELARRRVERETSELENALTQASDIYAGAVAVATDTD
jgi:hypothetical protein